MRQKLKYIYVHCTGRSTKSSVCCVGFLCDDKRKMGLNFSGHAAQCDISLLVFSRDMSLNNAQNIGRENPQMDCSKPQ